MSHWMYVNGTIQVWLSGRTQAECDYIINTVLAHLPLVTGSEGDMDVYVIKKNGYSSSSSHDEYGEQTNNLVDRYGRHGYKNGWLNVQDNYILIVDGSLRDREFEQTYREFQKWLCRLAKRIIIDDILVKIDDCYERSEIITNKNDVYGKMNEPPSWISKDGEPSWEEHLRWLPAKDCRMPLSLAVKYYADEELDNEFERRRNWVRS